MALPPYSLHVILLLLLLLHPSNQNSLNPTEIQALFDIRNNLQSLPGSNFFSTWNFNSSLDPCTSFSGIVCSLDPSDSSTPRVSALTLGTGLSNSPGLTGSLSNSISSLTSLTELIIYPGRISGPIPIEIGLKCTHLRLISISSNHISGEIPDSFSLLTELHTLDLSHNNLTGTIPVSLLSALPNLKILVLASNNLSGFIPSLSFSPLIHLDLHQNSFIGVLPPLPSTIHYISVAENSLYGSINAALSSDLFELTYIDLSMNKFTGKIPTTIFALPQLYTILLQRNNFSGPLVMPERVLPPWQVVDLSHNVISGEVPAGLAIAESLFLNSNRLIGAIPKEFAEKIYDGSMTTFYAQHNFLTGFSLQEGGQLPELVSVCLSYNCMYLPEVMESGCPASAGTRQPRPKEQCPSYN